MIAAHTITITRPEPQLSRQEQEEALNELLKDGWTIVQDINAWHAIAGDFYEAYHQNDEIGMLTALQKIDDSGDRSSLEYLDSVYQDWRIYGIPQSDFQGPVSF